jgi:hypothetical protein
MIKNTKIDFPSQRFSETLKENGIIINEPLFCTYKLPNELDEQKLQDIVKEMHNNTDVKKNLILLNLSRQIKKMNPQLDGLELVPGSIFETKRFLYGIASRFTPRDIKYYLYLKSNKNNQIVDAKRQIQDKKIKKFTGSFVNFILEPNVINQIISKIDDQEQKKQIQNEINKFVFAANPRQLMEC